ncbi:carotenoid oxygenase family protein [Pseudonocardia eucalypti]|uniref:Dioxygenase n=1 Tax=Pseudonocardia eucalypti TaxID=648755 RepID=A0ABP9PGN4_9PSEU|nr:carotenoid cleavage dioxygenase [Pseudonocardia eucalypti]
MRLRDGRAEWYRNRWIRSPAVSRALGERPIRPNHRAGVYVPAPNTNPIGHAGRTIATMEGGVANFELTEELDTIGPCDFGGTLSGGYTGHPKIDPVTGEMHAITYRVTTGEFAEYSVIGTDGRACKVVRFDSPGKPLLHDIALTENYVLFFDTPLVVDKIGVVERQLPDWLPRSTRLVLASLASRVVMPDRLVSRFTRRELIRQPDVAPIRWDPDRPSRIGLLPREGEAVVRWFEIEPCYVFHTLNAYEENGSVVCEAVRIHGYDRAAQYQLKDIFDTGRPMMHRWTVDLGSGKVRESGIDDRPQEFPGVDPRRIGRRHRYGYSTATTLGWHSDRDSVLRHDLAQDVTTELPLPEHHFAGEFSFVPNGDGAAEDDGVLMGFVYDRTTGRSNLSLLDSATGEAVATVHLPTRVPFGFHGNWVSA